MYGYYRLAAAVPQTRPADVTYNVARILELIDSASEAQCAAVVFPELTLTGYSCGDLFFQQRLREAALDGLRTICEATRAEASVIIVGLPYEYNSALYNVAAVLHRGRILALVPKTVLPNYREFYEKRQFQPATTLPAPVIPVTVNDQETKLTRYAIFSANAGAFTFGVEICEDLWCVTPPGGQLALMGALAILNPSAGTELAGKAEYRRELVKQQSARCLGAYVLSSAGVHESTTDVVFGGHALIADNGHLTAQAPRFRRENTLITADIDFENLSQARLSESSFNDTPRIPGITPDLIPLGPVPGSPDLSRAHLPARPFVPESDSSTRYREILDIQCAGLAKRMEHTRLRKLILGISGGLDSTLALLVCARTCKLLAIPNDHILAVTMPGFGTTDRTYQNALDMARHLGAQVREIPIKDACLQHFKDIGHDPAEHTVTYENTQARERTQILMDLANKTGALLVGTGDLSEIALGWSTYNGDHMSMYAVNCSIPKTLIRYLIRHVADDSSPELAATLQDVIDTPVSPELLPPDPSGNIKQKTENVLGPYDLHDFFLYHFIKHGSSPEKILALATTAFDGEFEPAAIRVCLEKFLKRFFTQQFKRSCIPDGPKVGSIALSPRGDWRMPSDASMTEWILPDASL